MTSLDKAAQVINRAEAVGLTKATSKVERLQEAVNAMLEEINSYKEYENTMRVRPLKMSLPSTYGLTEEDMKP